MAKVDTSKVSKAFFRSVEWKNIVAMGQAFFQKRLTGGFRAMANKNQGKWAALSPAYLEWKKRHGLDPRKWIRTGATMAALSSGRPTGDGHGRVVKGIRFKVTRGRRIRATVRAVVFRGVKFGGKSAKPRGKRGSKDLQARIYKILNWGIDAQKRGLLKGKRIRDKNRRVMNGFPARVLYRWDRGEMGPIVQDVEREMSRILKEAGL